MKKKPALAFIGSGNTAWSLAIAFQEAGYPIQGIASRNTKTGKSLARKLHTNFTDTATLVSEASVCFICVQDRYVQEVASSLPQTSAILVHCSGSAPITELGNKAFAGVFYPVISMRAGRIISFTGIPVCVESANPAILKLLKQLGHSIGARVEELDSRKRLQLHLAAVFVNNFSNACFTAAEDITKDAGISFSLLRPLLLESLQLMEKYSPTESQTGPARRGDKIILKKHLALLSELPEHRKLYQAISGFIRKKYE